MGSKVFDRAEFEKEKETEIKRAISILNFSEKVKIF